jgi:hypothetical protein
MSLQLRASISLSSSPSFTPRFGKLRPRSRVAKSRVATFHTSKSCPQVELRAEAARQTPATSLNHQTTRTPNTKQRKKPEKTGKAPNLRPIEASKQKRTLLQNVRPCPQRRHHHRRSGSKRCPRPVWFPQRDHRRASDGQAQLWCGVQG